MVQSLYGQPNTLLGKDIKMIKKLLASILIIGCCFSAVVVAEESGKETLILDDFSGGLASKVSPFGLPSKFATIAENLRFNSKYRSISRRSNLNVYGTADATEPITGMFRHYNKSGSKVLVVTHGDEMEKGSDTAGTFSNILNLWGL